MSTMTPMVNHQHPAGSGIHPHGWLQFHHTPFQPHHPLLPGQPMPITNGSGRFDSQRSLPRFIPPCGVYEECVGFSLYGETPMNYSHHPWELEALQDPMRKEVGVVRKMIDTLNKELKPLGITCQKKTRPRIKQMIIRPTVLFSELNCPGLASTSTLLSVQT